MAKDLQVLANWSQFFDGISHSSENFYKEVTVAVQARKIPDVKCSTVEHKLGGLFSDKRAYLRVERKDLVYDIGAYPFGTGFFICSWMQGPRENDGFITQVFGETAGALTKAMVNPETFYKAETAAMFKLAVTSAVEEVIGKIMDAAGRPMPVDPTVSKRPGNASFYGS